MAPTEYTDWRKSTHSDAEGNCVEVGESTDGAMIGVRDTKNRTGGTLEFSRASWQMFVTGVRKGEFNL